MVSGVISWADKLGGGWKSEKVPRTAKRYGDDGVKKLFG